MSSVENCTSELSPNLLHRITFEMPFKLLVITRNYPPQTGGLENFSFNLIRELKRHLPVQTITLKKTKFHLLLFFPISIILGLFFIKTKSISIVHICDGFLSPVGFVLKLFTRTQVTATVHGLDVTYGNLIYQFLIPKCLNKLNKIICVSRSTRDECVKRGILAKRCNVIPNGINVDAIYLSTGKEKLLEQIKGELKCSLKNKMILVTVGRLVKRKGIGWFVETVMSRLRQGYIYIIVGTGPEFSNIQEIIHKKRLHERVLLIGKKPDRFRDILLNAADAFIMPNISIPDDVEGFGISALEAGACGLPVIASNIQGIRDAVLDGITGYLVEEGDVEGYISKIHSLDFERAKIRSVVISMFNWEKIGRLYVQALIPGNKRSFC